MSKLAAKQCRDKDAILVPSLRTKESVEVQWQDEAVEGILSDTLVALHGVRSAATDVQGAVLGPTPTTTPSSLGFRIVDPEDPEQTQSCMPKVKQQDQKRVLQETREQPARNDHQPDPTTHPTTTPSR